MEKSFIAHPWIQRSVVGLEEYSAHDWRAATSGTARSSYLARVGPVVWPASETHLIKIFYLDSEIFWKSFLYFSFDWSNPIYTNLIM